MDDTVPEDDDERRNPPVPTLHQPDAPVTVYAQVGTADLAQRVRVVELTDRTVVVELDSAPAALALSLAPEVRVFLEVAGGEQVMLARPGQRASDNPTSRRVELVFVAPWR